MATAGVVVPLADVVRYAQNRAEVSLLLDIGLLGRLFESAAASAREWHRRATVGALAEACEANERYQLSVRVGLWAGPRPGQILRGVCSGACRDQLPAVAALLGTNCPLQPTHPQSGSPRPPCALGNYAMCRPRH